MWGRAKREGWDKLSDEDFRAVADNLPNLVPAASKIAELKALLKMLPDQRGSPKFPQLAENARSRVLDLDEEFRRLKGLFDSLLDMRPRARALFVEVLSPSPKRIRFDPEDGVSLGRRNIDGLWTAFSKEHVRVSAHGPGFTVRSTGKGLTVLRAPDGQSDTEVLLGLGDECTVELHATTGSRSFRFRIREA